MDLRVKDLMDMAADLLDIIPDGWERDIHRDLGKLAEETGEVAEALNKRSKTLQDLADELADVVNVCFFIAAKKGLDMEAACVNKHAERVEKRIKFHHNGVRPEGLCPRWKI